MASLRAFPFSRTAQTLARYLFCFSFTFLFFSFFFCSHLLLFCEMKLRETFDESRKARRKEKARHQQGSKEVSNTTKEETEDTNTRTETRRLRLTSTQSKIRLAISLIYDRAWEKIFTEPSIQEYLEEEFTDTQQQHVKDKKRNHAVNCFIPFLSSVLPLHSLSWCHDSFIHSIPSK